MVRHAASSESGVLTKNHASAIVIRMATDHDDYAARLSDALVSEIKAEMGRQDLSSRALGRLIGQSSQYVSFRLDGGNPKTGERVTLNVRDMGSIASALGLPLEELLRRAQEAAARSEQSAVVRSLPTLGSRERRVSELADEAARDNS